MVKRFKSLIQFTVHFKDDLACRVELERLIWDNNPRCPHCKTLAPYRLSDGKTFKCANPVCRKKFTVATGTIFQGTLLPLPIWFAAIYLMTAHKKGISSVQLSKDMGITQRSAWHILHKIRKIMSDPNENLLMNIVEMDETYMKVGKKKQKGATGRSTKTKTPVIGLVERQGRVVTKVVGDTGSKTINEMISAVVSPEATVMTDGWKGYSKVKLLNKHLGIDHSKGVYAIGNVHTNTIEGFWSLLKRGIFGIYHKVSIQHLHRYCTEFEFRYNTRGLTDFNRFEYAIRQSGRRLRYKDLIRV